MVNVCCNMTFQKNKYSQIFYLHRTHLWICWNLCFCSYFLYALPTKWIHAHINWQVSYRVDDLRNCPSKFTAVSSSRLINEEFRFQLISCWFPNCSGDCWLLLLNSTTKTLFPVSKQDFYQFNCEVSNSIWIKLVQIGPNLFKLDQICSNRLNLVN